LLFVKRMICLLNRVYSCGDFHLEPYSSGVGSVFAPLSLGVAQRGACFSNRSLSHKENVGEPYELCKRMLKINDYILPTFHYSDSTKYLMLTEQI